MIHLAICLISASFIPRVVSAGVPMRTPDGSSGLRGSNGIMFLFTVIPAASRACSAALPVTPFAVTSTSIRWLSVPPETMREPGLRQFLGQDLRVGDHLGGVVP